MKFMYSYDFVLKDIFLLYVDDYRFETNNILLLFMSRFISKHFQVIVLKLQIDFECQLKSHRNEKKKKMRKKVALNHE